MRRLNDDDLDLQIVSIIRNQQNVGEIRSLEIVEALSDEIEIRCLAIAKIHSISRDSIWFERIVELFKIRLTQKLFNSELSNLKRSFIVGKLLNFLKFSKLETKTQIKRQMKNEPTLSTDNLEIVAKIEDGKIRSLLYECIDKLPEKIRNIFIQICAVGNYSAVASSLGVSRQYVSNVVREKSSDLRKCIENGTY